jgi:CRP/FNR family transcriptional regulator
MSKETDKQECAQCMDKVGCFEKLTDKELQMVSDSKLRIKFNKGEIVRKQGSFVSSVLFLKEGYMKVYKEFDHSEQSSIIHFHKPGDMIGLTDIFSESSVKFSVAAVTDCQVCCVNIRLFEKMLIDNGRFAADVIKSINQLTGGHFDYQLQNTHKQLHGRIANAFLILADEVFMSNNFGVYLSRNDIAEFTNMSSMSVVRILKDFKEDNVIEDKNGFIKILDHDKLLKISLLG